MYVCMYVCMCVEYSIIATGSSYIDCNNGLSIPGQESDSWQVCMCMYITSVCPFVCMHVRI